MKNSNPKLEKPSLAEASESAPGSIEAVTTRLLRWGRIAPSGLARVEYISDTSQKAVLQRLRDGFQKADIPFVEIALPMRKSASEQVRFLQTQLAQIESGVVSITGFSRAFSEDTPLLESLRILNYNRENLASYPLCQIWWMPRDFTQMFRQSIPDLNSWFIIKLRLDEVSAPSELPPQLVEVSTISQTISHAEGANASNFYANRFRTALQRQEDMEVLWQLWVDAVDPLLAVGRITEAIRLQEALLQEASENGIDMDHYLKSEHPQPKLMNNIGFIYHQEHQPEKTEPLYEKALAGWRTNLPEGHPDIATGLNNLAEIYRLQSRDIEAGSLFQEALAIRRAALPAGHPKIAVSLNNLARLYEDQERYAEAEALYEEALTIERSALPAGHPYIPACINNLAGLYYTQGRYAEAEPLYQEALTIRLASLPSGHPDIAQSLNNLAELYRRQGRYAEAEPLYREALNIDRTALPGDHPNIATDLNNLAGLYRSQNCYPEAETLYQEALAMRRAVLPPGHPDIAATLSNLAGVYQSQERYSEAELLYQEALNNLIARFGEEHPYTKIIAGNYAFLLDQIKKKDGCSAEVN